MRIIYKIGIGLYLFLVIIAAPFHIKARRWLNGRQGIWRKIRENINPGDKVIWIHCASLGEFEQGRPVIEELRRRLSDRKLLLTFFSPSGYELRKNYEGVDCVIYMPLDTRFNAWRFINLVKPEMVFFIKYDFWYYFLRTLRKKKIPVYLVSAKFRRDQVFFKWYGKWYRNVLKFFEILFVQNDESRRILGVIGIKNVIVAGDTRFDRVFNISKNSVEYPWIEPFSTNKTVIIAGSTWEKDEQILIEYINQSGPETRFILAPHEISEKKLVGLIELIEHRTVRFTDNDKSSYKNAKVLIVDTIGHLSSLYNYGNIAYIGGGFGKGIHNILEAATYGLPVIFGPNYKKFLEAVEMVEMKAAYSITNIEELKKVIDQFINNEKLLASCSQTALHYIKSRLGATNTILDQALINIL
jgi:3-deoxy-D-manno-octulosonic-acid transferase